MLTWQNQLGMAVSRNWAVSLRGHAEAFGKPEAEAVPACYFKCECDFRLMRDRR